MRLSNDNQIGESKDFSSEYNREMWVIDGQRSLDTDAK